MARRDAKRPQEMTKPENGDAGPTTYMTMMMVVMRREEERSRKTHC
jgi:hypothetical protein